MKTIANLLITLVLLISACTNSNQKSHQNKGNADTSMKSMDATGPMRESADDTTTIHPIAGDSVPMRDDKKR